MKKPELDFYYFDACPYCQRVINVINKYKIKVNWIDIYSDMNALRKLIQITGTKMVPCLFIDGDPMHESLDIMAWLEKNVERLDKTE